MATYIARCHMTLHDNLYYASHEFGRFYETEKYLHNYGLTYALGLPRLILIGHRNLVIKRSCNEKGLAATMSHQLIPFG
jgi:hypothetical protein